MRRLLFAVSLCVSMSVCAKPHIVLFESENLNLGSLGHDQVKKILQSKNTKSVKQLNDWLDTRGVKKVQKDLWLIRGAQVDLDAGAAKALKNEPWAVEVFEDRVRVFVPPAKKVIVKDALSDLEPDPKALWGLKAIGLYDMRTEFPELTGKGVRVGVLDTGIQSRHPEFVKYDKNGKYSVNTKAFRDFVNDIPREYDDHGHGTHVTGTIAGAEVGMAPEAELIEGKIFDAVGSGQDSEILEGMQWMYDPDGDPKTQDQPHVVSNSWGLDIAPGVNDANSPAVMVYRRAMNTWIAGGIVPVFAAGNSGAIPNGLPGGLPEAISVGATAPTGDIAEFSSRGPNLWTIGNNVLFLLKPDISAPGQSVSSAFPGNKYATWDGTSMATPHVAGAIALAMQADPKLTPAEIKKFLYQSAEAKLNTSFGYGTLNVHKLIQAVTASRKKRS